jgi:hypothetical protein
MQSFRLADRSALYFTPSAFLDPLSVTIRSKDENEKASAARAQTYFAYVKDTSDLIGNPGFRPGVKRDAQALGLISSQWLSGSRTRRKHHPNFPSSGEDQFLNSFIVRRYVATTRGVLVSHPATSVDDESWDPTRERWFARSLDAPAKVVVSGPVLDPGGAGYVSTLSHSVFRGKVATLHSVTDSVVAVMGMDLTMGYLHRYVLCKALEDHGRNLRVVSSL